MQQQQHRQEGVAVHIEGIPPLDRLFVLADIQPTVLATIDALKGMYSLLSVVNELEHRELVLKTCEVLIIRVGADLPREAYPTAVEPLLQIWQNSLSNNNNILRKHVLSILMSVTSNVQESDVLQLYSVCIPMLDYSLNVVDNAADAFLLEEAMKLWLTIVR